MSPSRIDLAVHGRVLVLTMSRPGARNAIDRVMADEIDAGLRRLDDDPDLWAGVLAGSDTHFSAGSDLRAGGDYVTDEGGEYGLIRRARRKPLVAAVEGPALGGGLEMVLACDVVVASASASFGLPEVRRGVVPTCAGLFRGPRALPLNVARELVLTGDPMSADRAFQLGLVNRMTEPGGASRGAQELAERICANSPIAVRACLGAMAQLVVAQDELGWQVTGEAIEAVAGTRDREEGIEAFLGKRPPMWLGR